MTKGLTETSVNVFPLGFLRNSLRFGPPFGAPTGVVGEVVGPEYHRQLVSRKQIRNNKVLVKKIQICYTIENVCTLYRYWQIF